MGFHRLGLFGGTFDPPHLGHLIVAQDAVERLALDRLLFVVAGLPPHKMGQRLSPPELRLEMVRAAVAGNSAFGVSAVEMEGHGPTYTVDTLRILREMHPKTELYFLLGADQLAEFHEWREPEAIVSLATLVTMAREGSGADPVSTMTLPANFKGDFVRIPVTRLDVSSTDIRGRVKEGRSVRYLVPPAVQRIMEDHGLYRSIP